MPMQVGAGKKKKEAMTLFEFRFKVIEFLTHPKSKTLKNTVHLDLWE